MQHSHQPAEAVRRRGDTATKWIDCLDHARALIGSLGTSCTAPLGLLKTLDYGKPPFSQVFLASIRNSRTAPASDIHVMLLSSMSMEVARTLAAR